jgi:hypothetical protein
VWLEYYEKGQVKLTVVPSTLNSKLHIPGTTLTQQQLQYVVIYSVHFLVIAEAEGCWQNNRSMCLMDAKGCKFPNFKETVSPD